MRLNARRNLGPSADPDAYWRRRFFILSGGLAVLTLLAWHFSGRQGPPAGTSAAARASMAAIQARDTLPAAAYGSAWPGWSPKPSAVAVPKPAARASAAAPAKRKPHPSPSASAGTARRRARPAAPGR